MDQPHQLEENCFKKSLFQNKPLHVLKLAFHKLNPSLILCMNSVYTPSVGVVEFAEYVCTHPCLIFTEEDSDFIPEDIE